MTIHETHMRLSSTFKFISDSSNKNPLTKRPENINYKGILGSNFFCYSPRGLYHLCHYMLIFFYYIPDCLCFRVLIHVEAACACRQRIPTHYSHSCSIANRTLGNRYCRSLELSLQGFPFSIQLLQVWSGDCGLQIQRGSEQISNSDEEEEYRYMQLDKFEGCSQDTFQCPSMVNHL